MDKCRKLVDLNPNTSSALVIHFLPKPVYHPLLFVQKSHKLLSDENFGLDTQYVQNNTAIQHHRYIVNVPFTSTQTSQSEVVNQQLRFLFIFIIFYLLVFICPFISMGR